MATGMQVFSAPEDNELIERVGRYWDFIEGFPVPKQEMTCTCGSTDVKVCYFTFQQREQAHITQKGGMAQGCDMMFRCRTCSRFIHFSVAITPEVFALRSPDGQPTMYHWEKALKVIEG